MAKASEKAVIRQAEGEERKAALSSVLSKIEKDFGKGSVMKLGDAANMNVEVISTGS
ncbi:MAG: DNA recombination/repair protein RecA, partial [Clostridia bacterium]|nr:DNA recombination/repair protein RecA [Clostridia bacterium]